MFKILGKWEKYWVCGLLEIKIPSEKLLDNYQIVHHLNKVILIPLAD